VGCSSDPHHNRSGRVSPSFRAPLGFSELITGSLENLEKIMELKKNLFTRLEMSLKILFYHNSCGKVMEMLSCSFTQFDKKNKHVSKYLLFLSNYRLLFICVI